MNHKQVPKIVLTALFAGIDFCRYIVIKVPTVGTNGYVNIGDTLVLLSAWLIGGVYGGLAAGIGSALSDLIAGYGTYVPGTLIIKFLMAIVAYLIFYGIQEDKSEQSSGLSVSGIVAELIMVFGYFLYESTLLGYGLAAAASIPSNFIQAGTCLVLGYVLAGVLEGAKATSLIQKYC